jgi:hypothetical protein
MGMYDHIKCEYPLEDKEVQHSEFQTKTFGDGYSGGFLDNYTITKEGRLVFHKVEWEYVEEEDRPYYGKPEWDENSIYRMMGSLKRIPIEDEDINFNGILNMYTIHNGIFYEYNVGFVDGKIHDIVRIHREFG